MAKKKANGSLARRPTASLKAAFDADPKGELIEAALLAQDKATGRPTDYCPELAAEIVRRLGEGETLRALCRDPQMPSNWAIYHWMAQHEPFASAVRLARTIRQADSLVDEALDEARLADDKDSAMSARVKTETFLKVAGRLNPRQWGERTDGSGTVNIQINTSLPSPFAAAKPGHYVIEAEPTTSGADD